MENNAIFVKGMFLNKVSDKAPMFIITNQSIHLESLYNWLRENKNLADEKGYINIVGKESKEGKRYFVVDTWKPKPQEPLSELPKVAVDITTEFNGEVKNVDDIPF